MRPRAREFWSSDRRFGVRMPGEVVGEMERLCLGSARRETGGILVGRYSEDLRCAEVTEISGPPEDSKQTHDWLLRGVRGLLDRLRLLWKARREYYLGDWHFHPSGDMSESPTDVSTMVAVSRSDHTDCPEPVHILAGLGKTGDLLMRVTVYVRSQGCIDLKEM